MRILVHICCAVCWAKTLHGLKTLLPGEAEIEGLWYNPNIHPLLEYRRRLKALQVFMERDNTPVSIMDEYGLEPFCLAVHRHYQMPERCHRCYSLRMEQTAAYAAANGFYQFTTTMVTSTHQDHGMIRAAGEDAAGRHGLDFFYMDLRRIDVPESLTRGIYHQQYCGCVFSENDRYENTTKHLYRGDTGEN